MEAFIAERSSTMTDAPHEPTPAPVYYTSATPPPPVGPDGSDGSDSTVPPKPEAPKRSASVGIIAALAVGALVGGVSGAGVSLWAVDANSSRVSDSNATPASITVNNAEDATLVTAVAAQASPSVVTISVTASNSAGSGSGVVINDDGYILTNTHVVTLDGAAASSVIQVETSDGRLLNAELVGTDPIVDLAVIKVDEAAELPAVDFADSSELNVGDTAIAIGAPLGLSGTVTNGIVSALNRSITVASSAVPDDASGDETTPNGESPFDFWNFDVPGEDGAETPQATSTISLSVIQTDAAINPGNSGGALLDAEGDVIGINVAIASAGGSSAAGSIGVGFAVPSNLAKRVAAEIIADGAATHGLLGAGVSDVSLESQPDATTLGANIESISADGAAEEAGLRVGDIVTRFNDIPITSSTDLTAQVRSLAGGATAEVTYVRDGDASTAEVTLGTLE
jgi:putative serine protease PepD